MKPALSPLVLLVAAIGLAWGTAAEAASHREAPLIALDPSADNTNVYAFVSYDTANLARPANDRRVTFILNANPGQDPSDRPNYFNFDDQVLYAVSTSTTTGTERPTTSFMSSASRPRTGRSGVRLS